MQNLQNLSMEELQALVGKLMEEKKALEEKNEKLRNKPSKVELTEEEKQQRKENTFKKLFEEASLKDWDGFIKVLTKTAQNKNADMFSINLTKEEFKALEEHGKIIISRHSYYYALEKKDGNINLVCINAPYRVMYEGIALYEVDHLKK